MKWFRLLILVGLVGALAAVWQRAHYFDFIFGRGDYWDFDTYYYTTLELLLGNNPYHTQYMATLGPPSVFIPFLPFSFFSLSTARIIFSFLSVTSGFVTCWLLAKKSQLPWKLEIFLLLSIVLFSAFPTRFTMITGQLNLLATLLITATLLTENQKVQGFALALLSLIKTFFLSALIVWVAAKKWLTLVCFGVVFVSLLVLTLVWIKPTYYLEFLQNRANSIFWQPDRITNLEYYNQSIKTSLSRIGLIESSVPIWIMIAVLSGWLVWRSKDIGLALTWSLLVSPVLWQHYFVMLFPTLVLSGLALSKVSWKWRVVWLLAFVLWWIEFPWIHPKVITWWLSILASHYTIAGWLLFALRVRVSGDLKLSESN